jgi:HPr kinase/phosphorylase
MSAIATIHANALLVGARGVLLRGPSGSGKSALTLDLIAQAQAQGLFARLIGDDRLSLSNHNGRIVARPHPAIAGAIEVRGVGVTRCAYEPAGVIRLIVDLVEKVERMPDSGSLTAKLCGATLPRLCQEARGPFAGRQIISFLHGLMT